MIQKIRGQSIIEYSLLAMIAIVGVIVMGPYVIRSVSANFKLWDETTQDSMHDSMILKNTTNGNNLIGECKCSETFKDGECGAHFLRSNHTCQSFERHKYKSCSPPDCIYGDGFEEKCEKDPACCNKYSFCSAIAGHSLSGCCGTVPGNPRPPTYDLNGLDHYKVPADPLDYSGYCLYGEEALINNCNPQDVRCMPIPEGSNYPDAGQCNAKCTDLPSAATPCPGSDQNLTESSRYRIIDACQAPRAHTIELMVDDEASIYASDALGNRGALLMNTSCLEGDAACRPCDEAIPHWQTSVPITFTIQPGTTSYLSVDLDNCGGTDYGVSLKDATINQCLAQVNTSYPIQDPLEGDGCPSTGCWLNTGYNQNNAKGVIFALSIPTDNPNDSNNFCRGTCPDYKSNPNAPKCIATCDSGHRADPATGLCTDPYPKLDCSVTASNAPAGVVVKRVTQGPDCTEHTFSCNTNEVLAGYCIRGTSDKPYASECSVAPHDPNYTDCPSNYRSMNEVYLMEGDACHSNNWVTADLYCIPCPSYCTKGCTYPPKYSAPTNVGGYKGNSDAHIICKP